jgi:methionyl-tRNA formyltransferase
MPKLFKVLTNLSPEDPLLERLTACSVIEQIFNEESDLSVLDGENIFLISFGKILEKSFLDRQRLVINLHNSLLPSYRGRHAFTWALIRGENYVGYSVHKVTPEVDAGPIYAQFKTPIYAKDDINTLFRRTAVELSEWLPSILDKIIYNKITPVPQVEEDATFFPKRTFGDMQIDMAKPLAEITNFVKAHRPPYTEGAYLKLGAERVHFDSVISSKPRYDKDIGFVSCDGEKVTLICADAEVQIAISSIVKVSDNQKS